MEPRTSCILGTQAVSLSSSLIIVLMLVVQDLVSVGLLLFFIFILLFFFSFWFSHYRGIPIFTNVLASPPSFPEHIWPCRVHTPVPVHRSSPLQLKLAVKARPSAERHVPWDELMPLEGRSGYWRCLQTAPFPLSTAWENDSLSSAGAQTAIWSVNVKCHW